MDGWRMYACMHVGICIGALKHTCTCVYTKYNYLHTHSKTSRSLSLRVSKGLESLAAHSRSLSLYV